ncbi:hypothetical protein BT69DRAFT_1350179 [Atractiella rhizophila]|nr:hypothetical protein BT69DRAFT_1350179 [Atractiella rhizophila]
MSSIDTNIDVLSKDEFDEEPQRPSRTLSLCFQKNCPLNSVIVDSITGAPKFQISTPRPSFHVLHRTISTFWAFPDSAKPSPPSDTEKKSGLDEFRLNQDALIVDVDGRDDKSVAPVPEPDPATGAVLVAEIEWHNNKPSVLRFVDRDCKFSREREVALKKFLVEATKMSTSRFLKSEDGPPLEWKEISYGGLSLHLPSPRRTGRSFVIRPPAKYRSIEAGKRKKKPEKYDESHTMIVKHFPKNNGWFKKCAKRDMGIDIYLDKADAVDLSPEEIVLSFCVMEHWRRRRETAILALELAIEAATCAF